MRLCTHRTSSEDQSCVTTLATLGGSGAGALLGWFATKSPTPHVALKRAQAYIHTVGKHQACNMSPASFIFAMKDEHFQSKWPLGRVQHACDKLAKKLIYASECAIYARTEFVKLNDMSSCNQAQLMLVAIDELRVKLQCVNEYLISTFGDEFILQYKHFKAHQELKKIARKSRKKQASF